MEVVDKVPEQVKENIHEQALENWHGEKNEPIT